MSLSGSFCQKWRSITMKKITKMLLVCILSFFTIQFTLIPQASASEINLLENVNIEPESGLPSFDSWEEANQYIEAVTTLVKDNTSFSTQSNIVPFSTNGTATVARRSYTSSVITLYLSYGTSGSGNTGRVTYANPYTVLSGVTLGVSWQEQYIHAQISTSGKDVYATSSGTLVFSFFVNGVTDIARQPVSLSGNIAVVR